MLGKRELDATAALLHNLRDVLTYQESGLRAVGVAFREHARSSAGDRLRVARGLLFDDVARVETQTSKLYDALLPFMCSLTDLSEDLVELARDLDVLSTPPHTVGTEAVSQDGGTVSGE